jgi:hypothetical protein
MIHALLPVLSAVRVAVALLPATAAAKTFEHAKLDETLRELIERGCVGMQSVIITVTPGNREGLREALASHGDPVTGEFSAINAIAATVHCADLTTLAGFGSVRAVSSNAIVGVNAVKEKDRASALARDLEGELATALTENEFTTLGVTTLREVKPTGLMLVETYGELTDDMSGSPLVGTRVSAPMPGYGIGVAVIDSGIEPGTDFDDRITAFYDFTAGDIRAVAPHDEYGHGTHVAGLIGSQFVVWRRTRA